MSQIHDSPHERSRSALRFVAVKGDAGDTSDAPKSILYEKSASRSAGYDDEKPRPAIFHHFFVAAGLKGITYQWVMGVPPLKYQ